MIQSRKRHITSLYQTFLNNYTKLQEVPSDDKTLPWSSYVFAKKPPSLENTMMETYIKAGLSELGELVCQFKFKGLEKANGLQLGLTCLNIQGSPLKTGAVPSRSKACVELEAISSNWVPPSSSEIFTSMISVSNGGPLVVQRFTVCYGRVSIGAQVPVCTSKTFQAEKQYEAEGHSLDWRSSGKQPLQLKLWWPVNGRPATGMPLTSYATPQYELVFSRISVLKCCQTYRFPWSVMIRILASRSGFLHSVDTFNWRYRVLELAAKCLARTNIWVQHMENSIKLYLLDHQFWTFYIT